MNKNIKVLFFVFVLTIILVAIFIFLNKDENSNMNKPDKIIKNSSSVLSNQIIKIDSSKIKAISIKNKISDFKIEIKSENDFYIKELPSECEINKDEIKRTVESLCNLFYMKIANEDSNQLEIYGLKEASSKIEIECKGEKTKELFLGINTPTNSGAYLKVNGDDTVYVISLSDARVFLSSVNDYTKSK